MKFDLDRLIFDCKEALKGNAPQATINELLARAVSDRASILSMLGEPKRAEMQKLYQGSDLTILNVIWAPWMTLLPSRAPTLSARWCVSACRASRTRQLRRDG